MTQPPFPILWSFRNHNSGLLPKTEHFTTANRPDINRSMTRSILSLLLATIATYPVRSQVQIPVKNLDMTIAPKGIAFEGKVKTAVRWSDPSGEHVVILSETGPYRSQKFKHESDGEDAELFAHHFIVQSDTAVRMWKVYDYVSDCPLDLEAGFIKNAFRVTDLDGNGVAEIWLMYKLACRGDVSPSDMKIIMYQDKQKFALRGQNKVKSGTDESGAEQYTGGECTFDPSFAKGPKEFKEFAQSLWDANLMEKWDE